MLLQTITKDAEAMREEWEKQQLMRKLKEIEEDNRKLQELLSADSSRVDVHNHASHHSHTSHHSHFISLTHHRRTTRSWGVWAWSMRV